MIGIFEESTATSLAWKDPTAAVLNQIAGVFMMAQVNFMFTSSSALIGMFYHQRNSDHNMELTESEVHSIISIMVYASTIGIIFACFLAQKLGSRRMIQLASVPTGTGWALMALGYEHWILFTGSLLVGVGIGLGIGPSFTYVSEISSERFRTCFMTTLVLFSSIGHAVTFLVGWKLGWRAVCLVNLVTVGFQFLISIALPDSAKWIITRGLCKEAARVSLIFFRGPNYNCEREISNIQLSLNQPGQLKSPTNIFEFVKKKYVWKPFMISCTLISFKLLSGAAAILTFNRIVFITLHVFENKYRDFLYGAIFCSICNLICICLTRVVKKRTLLIWNGAVGAVCGLMAAVYFFFERDLLEHPWTASVCVAVILTLVGMSSIGITPLTFLIVTEILPNTIRSTAINICLIIRSANVILMVNTFGPLLESIELSGIFIVFAVAHVLMLVFAALALPETGNKSLEEIQEMFEAPEDRRARFASLAPPTGYNATPNSNGLAINPL